MDAKSFFYLVKQMRQAQREYFAQRDTWTLRRARALEGDVDREILRVMDVIRAREQQGTDAQVTQGDAQVTQEPGALQVTMVPPSEILQGGGAYVQHVTE